MNIPHPHSRAPRLLLVDARDHCSDADCTAPQLKYGGTPESGGGCRALATSIKARKLLLVSVPHPETVY